MSCCCNFKQKLSPCLSTAGKIFIVTGGNCGIGYETAKQLALLGGHVVIGCRNEEKAKNAIKCMGNFENGSVEFISISLDNLETVKAFVKSFRKNHSRLDGVICNAGINSSGDPTKNVFEVNFTSHFYLVSLLMDLLRKSGTPNSPSRVITLSSAMHVIISKNKNGKPVFWEEGIEQYARSKLAMHLFANYINQHESPSVLGVAVNPGAVNSQIWRGSSKFVKCIANCLFLSEYEGAQPSVYAMASPSIVTTRGCLYVTPYAPIFYPCLRSCGSGLFRRTMILLSNLMEATFGRCLYQKACYGNSSAVSCDDKEINNLWNFANRKINKITGDQMKK